MKSLALLMSLAVAGFAAAQNVTLRFEVEVPKNTPDDAVVFVAGNLPQLGGWRADGLPLRRGDDGQYSGQAQVPANQLVEFKFTLGSWDGVEKTADGNEVANRQEAPDADTTVKAEVQRWNQLTPPPQRGPTLTGDVRVIENFNSDILDGPRAVRVYLPPGYDEPANAARRYPVLYLLDGQNLFDVTTAAFGVEWQADEAAERLIADEEIAPLIMVGVDNAGAGRIHEYTPVPGKIRDEENVGGGGPDFARFLRGELKPAIDERFRTRPEPRHTAIGGSSLGGLMALYLIHEHPDTFKSAAVVSPALWWAEQHLTRRVDADATPLAGATLWLDMGTEEGVGPEAEQDTPSRQLRSTRALADILERESDALDTAYRYVEVDGGQHNEAAWAARFPDILRFLYPPEPAEALEPAAEPE